MRSRIYRTCLAIPALLLLSTCGPQEENADAPFTQHAKDQRKQESDSALYGDFRPPPEIARTFGIAEKDNRAEIVLLQPSAKQPPQQFQRNVLSVLAGRQTGLKLTAEDAEGSPNTQLRQFRDALTRKPAAIILDPADGTDFSTVLPEALQAGTRVISLSSRFTATSSIYVPASAIGKAAAQLTLDALKRKAAEEGKTEVAGRVIQLRGPESSTQSDQISTAFEQGLRAQPGVILVHDAPADASKPELVVYRLQEALALQKQFDVIFCHSDTTAREASRFTTQQNLRENTLIIGIDGIPVRAQGLELLGTGEIDATLALAPLVDVALQLILKMRSDPAFVPAEHYEIPPVTVTPKNHGEFSTRLNFELPKF